MGLISVVEKLLERKAHTEIKNNDGDTPLHLAVEEGNIPSCEALLKGGANVNTQNDTLRTPLMSGCFAGNDQLVAAILQFNPNTSLKDINGFTADDCAIIKGYHSCSSLIGVYNHQQTVKVSLSDEGTPTSRRESISQKRVHLRGTSSEIKVPSLAGKEHSSTAVQQNVLSALKGGTGDSWDDSENDIDILERKNISGINLTKLLHSSNETLSESPQNAKKLSNVSPVKSPSKPDLVISKKLSIQNPPPTSPIAMENLVPCDQKLYSSDDSDVSNSYDKKTIEKTITENLVEENKKIEQIESTVDKNERKLSEKDKQKVLLLELGLSDVSNQDVSTPEFSETSFSKLSPEKFVQHYDMENKADIKSPKQSNISLKSPPPKPQRVFSDEKSPDHNVPSVNDKPELEEEKQNNVMRHLSSCDNSLSFENSLLKQKNNGVEKSHNESAFSSRRSSAIDQELEIVHQQNDFSKKSQGNSNVENKVMGTSSLLETVEEKKADELNTKKDIDILARSKPGRKFQKASADFDTDSDWDSDGGNKTSGIKKPFQTEYTLALGKEKSSHFLKSKEIIELKVPVKQNSNNMDTTSQSKKKSISYQPNAMIFEETHYNKNVPSLLLNDSYETINSVKNKILLLEKKDSGKTFSTKDGNGEGDRSCNDMKKITFDVFKPTPLETERSLQFNIEKSPKNDQKDYAADDDDSSWSSVGVKDSPLSAEPMLLKITKSGNKDDSFDPSDVNNKIILSKLDDNEQSELYSSKEMFPRKHKSDMEMNKSKSEKNIVSQGHKSSSSYPSLSTKLITDAKLFEAAGGEKSSSTTDEDLNYHSSFHRRSIGFMDAGDSIQIQDELQKDKNYFEKERSIRVSLEAKVKILERENLELERRLDELNKIRSMLEERLLETEARIRTLGSNLNEKGEKYKDLEILLSKSKEHLLRMEQKYTIELAGREKSEHRERNLQIELRTITSKLKQLEDEKEELESNLLQEKNARSLHEQFIKENVKQQHDENQKLSSQQAIVLSRLDEADIMRRQALSRCEQMQNELASVKRELELQRSHNKEQQGSLNQENEELYQRVDKMKREIQTQEISLTEATKMYNIQMETIKTDHANLLANLGKEKDLKAKLNVEIELLRSHLKNAEADKNKSEEIRLQLERNWEKQSEEFQQLKVKSQKEIETSRESYQNVVQNLNSTEKQLHQVEKELNTVNATLVERSNQVTELRKELSQKMNIQEENAKLIAKVDFFQERMAHLKEEYSSQKCKYEEVVDKLSNIKQIPSDNQEKFEFIISSLKVDQDKELLRLREELNHVISQKTAVETQLGIVQTEMNETIKKLAISEGESHISQKLLQHAELEKSSAQEVVEKLQQQLEILRDKHDEQTRLKSNQDNIDKSENIAPTQSQQPFYSDMNFLAQFKSEKEELLCRLEMENSRLEAALQHEMERIEYLEQELRDSHRVRNNMEALISSLKTANYHLEFKLKEEGELRVTMTREIEESRQMWESEVKSRSRLGEKLFELEKSSQKFEERILEEKTKKKNAIGFKKQAETRLQEETRKIIILNKKISILKSHLQASKKKLKESEFEDQRVASLHMQFENDRKSMECTVTELRIKLQELQIQLHKESENKEKWESLNLKLNQELNSRKAAIKGVEKLQSSKLKMEQEFSLYKAYVEENYILKSDLERFKYDLETKTRQELNVKLDQVNTYLEEQSLARERLDIIRNSTEAQMKADFEKNKQQLVEELVKLRTCFQQCNNTGVSLAEEKKHYKELYEAEIRAREKLNEKLTQINERTSPVKHMLEKQFSNRSYSLVATDLPHYNTNTPKTSPQPEYQMSLSPPVKDSLSFKLKSELDKTISKHLQGRSSPNDNPLIMDDSVLNRHSNQYLNILRRKYFV